MWRREKNGQVQKNFFKILGYIEKFFGREGGPDQLGRPVNGSKPIKNGGFTEIRQFSYTDISK
jgi:hypothetical protein